MHEDLEQAALELPPLERERLARRLLETLDDQPLSEIDQAWIEEADRRYEEMMSGKVQGILADEAVARIRRDFGWRD